VPAGRFGLSCSGAFVLIQLLMLVRLIMLFSFGLSLHFFAQIDFS